MPIRFTSVVTFLRRAVLASCLASAGTAAAPTPVIVGFDQGAAPFMSVEKGRAVGLYPDMVRAIFADADIPLRAESAPFNRVLGHVDRGEWGAGGILKTPDRIERYAFSDYLHLETLVVYYAKARPFTFTRLDDLRGKRVGVLLGWSYGEPFDLATPDLDIQVSRVPSDEVNFRKLQLGRLDAVIVLEEAGAALMATGRYPELARAPHLFRQNASAIAFNKKGVDAALIGSLNRSIAKLRNSGELARIARKHLSSQPARKQATSRQSTDNGRLGAPDKTSRHTSNR